MLYLYLSMLSSEKDRNFFEKIYLEHRDLMFNMANKILNDRHRAEDAVHSAFMKVINNVEKFYSMDCHKIKAYLVIVVENTAKDIYRVLDKSPVIEVQYDISDDGSTENRIHAHLEAGEMLDRIEALPQIYRDVLLLRCYHELSYNDIADILNMSEELARQRVARGRALLLNLGGK